jgi:hypothetical protein
MTASPNLPANDSQRWIAQTVGMGVEILDRMERAVANVRERLLRATQALNRAGVPYAVVGGNAIASWVATVDEGAVRNIRDVDILVRRTDLDAVTSALENAGFVATTSFEITMFRDGERGKPNEAVHLLFSGEKTKPDHVLPAPDIQTIEDPANFRVLKLDSLLLMKLTWNRNIDRVHIRDLIDVVLIDASWLPKLPAELATRLQQILNTPDG